MVTAYDCAMLDLDGVVYVGDQVVEGAAEVLEQVRAEGMTLAFVTNNASRTPSQVADRLTSLGVRATAGDVVTSAQAAARQLADRVPANAPVLVVGGEGLVEALEQAGLHPVSGVADHPVAVAQGFDRDLGWQDLAEAAYAVRAGALWVATNLDPTLPTNRGIAPGNGTLVDAVATALGRRPDIVAGKPHRPLFDETVRRVASRRPLVVGDRLNTDIEGAVAAGIDSLLVLTGVTDPAMLCRAAPGQRPTYIASGISGLLTPHPHPQGVAAGWSVNGWTAHLSGNTLEVESMGNEPDDGLRAAAAACWEAEAPEELDLAVLTELWSPGPE